MLVNFGCVPNPITHRLKVGSTFHTMAAEISGKKRVLAAGASHPCMHTKLPQGTLL